MILPIEFNMQTGFNIVIWKMIILSICWDGFTWLRQWLHKAVVNLFNFFCRVSYNMTINSIAKIAYDTKQL